jgi:probable HAF family extracellular repeat protein
VALLALVLAMGSSGASSAVLCPTISDLGKQPGWPAGGSPVAINDAGQIAGTAPAKGGGQQAFVWQQGRMTSLGTLGGKDSSVSAMNNRGQVIGFSTTKSGANHVFVWQAGKMTDLGSLGAKGAPSVAALNDALQIVGSIPVKGGRPHAFLWQRGKLTDLGTLPGGSESRAAGINAKGQVVGYSTSKSGGSHVVLWQNGKLRDLGTLPGGVETSATGINDKGQIIGDRTTEDAAQRNTSYAYKTHAFLWQNAKTIDLGTFPGGVDSHADAVNEKGQVVGWSATFGYYEQPSRAFLWQAGRMTDLGTLPGDLESEAVALNDSGQMIGWSSASRSGTVRYALWTLRATSAACPVFKPSHSGDSVLVRQNSITVTGSISALRADAGRAILLVKKDPTCADIFVWNPANGKLVTVHDRRMCSHAAYEQTFGPIALAGANAAYIHAAAGNDLDSFLFRMSLTTGYYALVDVESAGDQGADGPVLTDVVGKGEVLVYEDQTNCVPDVSCPPGVEGGGLAKDEIRLALPVRRVIATSDQELTVLAVGGGRVIVATDAGPVIALAPKRVSTGLVDYQGFRAEHLIATYDYKPGQVGAAATDGHTLALLRQGALDIIQLPGSKSAPSTRTLRLRAEDLAGLDGNLLAYTQGDSVHLLDLTTGHSALIARPKGGLAGAELAHDGLYISAGNTVTFTPRNQLQQRLRH